MASSELAEGVASSALAEGVAAALELSKALEAKLEGAARSEAAALTACLAGLVSGGGDGGAAAGDGAAAAGDGGAAGAELAAAAATSCMVPRGKFDLRLHDGAPNTLHGIASSGASRWSLAMDDVVQLVTVPKGDSVKPTTLVVAQLRQPLPTFKKDGSLKSKGSPYLVLQFPSKQLEAAPAADFVAALTRASNAKMCVPSAAAFRSMCSRPNQPDCALKCFRDVHDGYLYLVKGCMLFVPSGGSNILALRTQWLGSVSFARSPTGRSFQMTVEVDGGRVDSETAGSAAAMDSAYTFMEMDVADENTVNEYVKTCIVRPSRKAAAAGGANRSSTGGAAGEMDESSSDDGDDDDDESYDENTVKEERVGAKRKRQQRNDDDSAGSEEDSDGSSSSGSEDEDADEDEEAEAEAEADSGDSDIDLDDEPSSVFSPPTQDDPSGPSVSPPDTKPPVQPAPKTEAQQRTLQSFFAAR